MLEEKEKTGLKKHQLDKANRVRKAKNYVAMEKQKSLEVKIDPNSIRYYDESFSLFKSDEKESANKAQTFAEKDAKKESTKSNISEHE